MRRRDFLITVPLVCWGAGTWMPVESDNSTHELHCYIAGVKYHKPRAVRPGQLVRIVRQTFDNKTCFAVLDDAGNRIGYVPKPLVPALQGKRIFDSRISAVREFAVPWRRYRLSILAANE